MENLPNEIVKHIFFYTNLCKKNNFYGINKRIYKIIREKICNCHKIKIFNHNLCTQCDKNTILFINTYCYGDKDIPLY